MNTNTGYRMINYAETTDLDEMSSYAKSTARAIGKVTTSIGIGNGNP